MKPPRPIACDLTFLDERANQCVKLLHVLKSGRALSGLAMIPVMAAINKYERNGMGIDQDPHRITRMHRLRRTKFAPHANAQQHLGVKGYATGIADSGVLGMQGMQKSFSSPRLIMTFEEQSIAKRCPIRHAPVRATLQVLGLWINDNDLGNTLDGSYHDLVPKAT